MVLRLIAFDLIILMLLIFERTNTNFYNNEDLFN